MTSDSLDLPNEQKVEESSQQTKKRTIVKLVLLVVILVLINYSMGWFARLTAFQLWPRHVNMAIYILVASAVLYILLMSLPFMPGIEVGLMLMALMGREGIVIVYLCTVLALSLSFLLGRLTPPSLLARTLGWFGLNKARAFVEQMAAMNYQDRFAFILRSAPMGIVPFLLHRRYLIIGVLFNLPGNALIGGGGGIGMVVGMSRLFSFPKYLLIVSIAITPAPIFFLLQFG